MTSPQNLLLIRMLRYQSQLTEEQLRSILAEAGQGEKSLVEVVRRSGLVDPEWIEQTSRSLRRKVRRFQQDVQQQAYHDRSFGQLALTRGWVDLGALEDAILEQQRLRRVNLKFRLGEILVRQGTLSVSQVRDILAEQGERLWRCSECDAIVKASGESDPDCPFCNGRLEAAVFLESVRCDGRVATP